MKDLRLLEENEYKMQKHSLNKFIIHLHRIKQSDWSIAIPGIPPLLLHRCMCML